MISKNELKRLKSLKKKKYRQEYGLFIAEGSKIIYELIEQNLSVEALYATEGSLSDTLPHTLVSAETFSRMSSQKNPDGVLGIFHIPRPLPIPDDGLLLALDNINDPGNIGTIVRLCDWYGVSHLLCNLHTVDIYNPKSVQATMGSIARVAVHYIDLGRYVRTTKRAVYGLDMDGDSLSNIVIPNDALLIMGNESQGLSSSISSQIKRLTIPRYNNTSFPESLNVAMATAITLHHARSVIE